MVKIKKRSKRVTTKTRCKIEKKVRAHNKKARRDAKKNPTKKKKDPGIPNSYPFKEELLLEAEAHKKRLEEEREKQKERRKKERSRLMEKKRNLAGLVSDAARRTNEFDKKTGHVKNKDQSYTGGKTVESSLKAYYKEFKKVVDAADVVLEVLDARDPLGSRCPQVEEAVLAAGSNKKLVLVLNKIDLVPRTNVEEWLKYLRNELPTIAFKASTQTQKNNLSQSRVSLEAASDDLRKASGCLGADVLMKLLANYCRNEDIKTAIRVGIVGFPNTGKSSIINSLKRSKACNVGATPGVTKSMQEVQLDKHVKLLDSPGIVMATGSSDAHVILRNCVRLECLEDPVPAVAAILGRCSQQQMMVHYRISTFRDVTEFLSLLAMRFGRLKKRGVPDVNKAARIVLQDWNTGKIKYYTHPPEVSAGTHIASEIVMKMSRQFDIDSLLEDEKNTLKALSSTKDSDMMIESIGPMKGLIPDSATMEHVVEESNEGEMEEDEWEDEEEEGEEGEAGASDESEMDVVEDTSELSKAVVVETKTAAKPTKTAGLVATRSGSKGRSVEMSLEGNLQRGRSRKQDFKKMKKNRKRADVVAGSLSDAFSGALSGLGTTASDSTEDYNFGTDFQ